MSKLAVGAAVPDFELPSTAGGRFSLRKAHGNKVVVFFYPKDMTSGCTREAQDFRDHQQDFVGAGVIVVGVSRDPLASHEKFRKKESLNFALLSDADEKVCKLFDVIREKSLYGRKYLGIDRSTFLIDARGKLVREWRSVKVPGHVAEVLSAAQSA